MARVANTVTVHTGHRGSITLNPDTDVPDWAVALVQNRSAWAVPPTQEEVAQSQKLLATETDRAAQAMEAATTTDAEITRSRNTLHHSRVETARGRAAAELSRQVEEVSAAERKRQTENR